MRAALLCLLAAALALPAVSAEGKKARKKGEKPAAPATVVPAVPRTLCGVTLRMSAAELEKAVKVRDLTEVYKRSLNEGDRAYSVQDALEPGSSGCIATTYEGHVWRIEATFPPSHTRSNPWEPMVEKHTKAFGEPEKSEQANESTEKLRLTWKDGMTRLLNTRQVRGKDSPVPSEQNLIYYLVAIEDIALSMRPKKEEAPPK